MHGVTGMSRIAFAITSTPHTDSPAAIGEATLLITSFRSSSEGRTSPRICGRSRALSQSEKISTKAVYTMKSVVVELRSARPARKCYDFGGGETLPGARDSVSGSRLQQKSEVLRVCNRCHAWQGRLATSFTATIPLLVVSVMNVPSPIRNFDPHIIKKFRLSIEYLELKHSE